MKEARKMFNLLSGKFWIFRHKGYYSTKSQIALSVIEAVCEDRCIGPTRHIAGEECFPCYIYMLAHSASRCGNGHGWFENTEKTYRVLENG